MDAGLNLRRLWLQHLLEIEVLTVLPKRTTSSLVLDYSCSVSDRLSVSVPLPHWPAVFKLYFALLGDFWASWFVFWVCTNFRPVVALTIKPFRRDGLKILNSDGYASHEIINNKLN